MSLEKTPRTDSEKQLPEDRLETTREAAYNEPGTFQDKKLLRKVDLR
jgi:hypothetical protein